MSRNPVAPAGQLQVRWPIRLRPSGARTSSLAGEVGEDVGPDTQAGAAAAPRARAVAAVLPSGRSVWLRISPAPATAAATNELVRGMERVEERRQAALRAQKTQLDGLAQRVARDAERLSRAQVASSRKLHRRLMTASDRVARRVSSELEAQGTALRRQMKLEREVARGIGRGDLWDKLVLASSAPLFVAYGQPGCPWATNNVALMLSLAMWLVGDDVMKALSWSRESSLERLRKPDVWGMLAPPGNLLTGWWLMHNRQHERFIAGVAGWAAEPATANLPNAPVVRKASHALVAAAETLDEVAEKTLRKQPEKRRREEILKITVDLSSYVAAEYLDEFATLAHVPVVASPMRIETADGICAQVRGVCAKVEGLRLLLSARFLVRLSESHKKFPKHPISKLELAWMVDTQARR